MQQTVSSKRRKLYLAGKKMTNIPILSLIQYSAVFTVAAATIMAIFLEGWRLIDSSGIGFIIAVIGYAVLLMIATVFLGITLKVFSMLLGWVMCRLGIPDKITLERRNNHKLIEIKIENQEEQKFTGEFKIQKINDDQLSTPLTMGVFRGRHMDSQIVIPKHESVAVMIGLFDDELGYAYFVDAYNQQKVLLPQTKIYTKLSGNLESNDEIVKEQRWFIDYKNYENGKGLSLSNLIEIKEQKLGLGSMNLGFIMTSKRKKVVKASKKS
jgi:hypothetical protein